jgi:hypothetical protein
VFANECRCGLFFRRPICSGKEAEHAQARRNQGNCHSFPFTRICHIINESLACFDRFATLVTSFHQRQCTATRNNDVLNSLNVQRYVERCSLSEVGKHISKRPVYRLASSSPQTESSAQSNVRMNEPTISDIWIVIIKLFLRILQALL